MFLLTEFPGSEDEVILRSTKNGFEGALSGDVTAMGRILVAQEEPFNLKQIV
jgi:hypothetical protein